MYTVRVMQFDNNAPQLIEPGAVDHLNKRLSQAHIFKIEYNRHRYHLTVFAGFCVFMMCVLGLSKLATLSVKTAAENHQQAQRVLNELQHLHPGQQVAKQVESKHPDLITGLPMWDSSNF
jgi:hypothetical protein